MRVVPTLHPGEDGQMGFCFVFPSAPGDEFALQAGREAFGHGVVIGVAASAHGETHAHLSTSAAEGDAGVLAALVGVRNHRLGPTGVQGHVQR